MKPEYLAKARATNEARKAEFAAQVIKIDDDWRIIRADEYNWEIQRKLKFYGFYGCLTRAFEAVAGKMLDSEAKDSLQAALESHRAIILRVAMALKPFEKAQP